MLVVTGGAGFIGSNLVAALSERRARDVVVCDWLGAGAKRRNIAKHAETTGRKLTPDRRRSPCAGYANLAPYLVLWFGRS